MRAKFRRLLQRAVFSALSPALASLALAVTDTYTGPDGGNWNTAANWTTSTNAHTIPVIGDDAFVGTISTINSVIFNAAYSGAGLDLLVLDSSGHASVTLKQTSASVMIAANETIGSTANLSVYTQSAGSNTVTNTLTLGSGASTGNYNLSGAAAVSLTVNGFEAIASNGNATFTQNGGTHTLNGDMQIGEFAGGNGTYLLQSGAFNENTNIGVGQVGLGTFTQSGGTANITLGLYVGSGNGSIGAYSLGNGSLTVGVGSSDEYIGYNGNGTFTQTGGTHTVVNALTIANNAGSTGNFTLSNGSLSVGANAPAFSVGVSVGLNGTATFTQSGGSHTVGSPASNQDLDVGQAALGVGTYTLNNAAATLTVNGSEFIGDSATGTTSNGTITQYGGVFYQSAGNHTVSSQLSVANGSGSTGSFSLSGGNLSVLDGEFVGYAGTGSFIQSGGTNLIGNSTSPGYLDIGSSSGGTGTYTINNPGATLTLANGGGCFIGGISLGPRGVGALNISAGNVSINGMLKIWASSSAVTLSGGNLTVSGTGSAFTSGEYIGEGGVGNFTQTGGTNTIGTPAVNQYLMVGDAVGSAGSYILDNASSILTVNGALFLANDFGATGSFIMNGGNLTVTEAEVIGFGGTGNFSQSGGSNTIGNLSAVNNFDLGGFSGAIGTYTLNSANATLTVLNGGCYVGGISSAAGGTGTLNLSAGTVTINGPLKIWTTGSAVNFSGGTLNLQSLDTSGLPSRFNWTAGTLNFINGLTLDSSFTLGPSLTLNTGMTLGANPGQSITNNGALILAGGNINAGSFVNNTSLTGTGNITTSAGFTNNGQITLSGGSLAINLGSFFFANAGAISLAPGFQLQLTASSAANHGTINLNGGAITGLLQLTNASDGVITGPGNISAGFINQGTLFAPTGTTKVGSFTNAGIIEMSGAAAQLGSGGTITNNTLIEGFGKISDAVTNNATIQPIGGTLNISGTLTNPASGLLAASTGNTLLISSGLATNAGILSLTGGTFDNGNQPLNNTGQITGYGTLRTGGAGLTNNNAITFTGGTSTINGPVINAVNKTLIAKNDPAIFTGPVTNNGIILVTNTTITFAGPYSGNAYISDPSTNIFQSSATITPGGSMTGGSSDQFIFAGPFTNNGNFTNAGSLQVTANITNTATFTQSGPQAWSLNATFTNTAGTATFISSNAKLGGLTITGGTVDITSSKFIIEPASKSTTLAALQSNIANHSLIASGIPANYGLALLDNALLNKSTFGGNPVDTNSLLLSSELLGDANADGTVDLSDLSTLLNNFGTATAAWTSGNFDHAPTIDLTDLADVLNNFGLTNPNASDTLPIPTPTPEPASLALFALSSYALLTRARR